MNVLKKCLSRNVFNYVQVGEPSSLVTLVSGYGLGDRAIKVRSPAEAKGFFL
jgi:hypothetical protein